MTANCKLSDLWETPDYIFNPLNDRFHFTLDPCCTKENARATEFFTIAEDGLNRSWGSHMVFCNPPYSRGLIDAWTYKIWQESTRGNGCKIVALLPVSTSTFWFHNYVQGKGEIQFLKGRVKFKNNRSSPPFSSMLVYYGFDSPQT